jgi:hypothetical protein
MRVLDMIRQEPDITQTKVSRGGPPDGFAKWDPSRPFPRHATSRVLQIHPAASTILLKTIKTYA